AGWRPQSGTEPDLLPFEFVLRDGSRGEVAKPVAVAEISATHSELPAQADLAFAKVVAGGSVDGCLSGLGPSPLTFQRIQNDDTARFTVRSIGPKSEGLYRFLPGLHESGPSPWRVRLRAETERDRRALRGGLSGAVARTDVIGFPRPYAMITDVFDNGAVGIRFDAIARAHEALARTLNDSSMHRIETSEPTGHHPFTIVSYSGTKTEGASGPSALLQQDGCWRVRADDGKRWIEVVLDPSGTDRINALTVHTSAECSLNESQASEIAVGIDVSFDDGRTWVRVHDCALKVGVDQHACRVARGGERNYLIRVRLLTESLSLARVTLEPTR
ncbi:MAG: hypothetical protein NXH88_15345, partial [Hyphomonas sp.]|nr:hypothetical protein [Hyphomonas sp.]